jgi:DNA/RNA endonuclease YhcR with UshA esterase domain
MLLGVNHTNFKEVKVMKKTFVFGIAAVMIFGVLALSSCFTPAPKPVVNLGTALHDAISSWSTDVSINATGVVIGYPGRKIGSDCVGGFSGKLYIEDSKGGAYVYSKEINESYDSTPSSYKYAIGDVVTVSGTLTKYHDDFEIKTATSDIVKTGKTFDVVPDDLTTSDATLTGHLLRLVKVSGTATDVSAKAFKLVTGTEAGTLTIKDNTYGKILDFDTYIKNGDKVEVTGISSIYYGAPTVFPREAADTVVK